MRSRQKKLGTQVKVSLKLCQSFLKLDVSDVYFLFAPSQSLIKISPPLPLIVIVLIYVSFIRKLNICSCLSTTCIFTSANCLFVFFTHFPSGKFILLICKNAFFIKDIYL